MVKVGPQGVIDTSMLQTALDLIQGRFETEASGNVTIATIGNNFLCAVFWMCFTSFAFLGTIAKTNVDFISSGALTHSVVRALVDFPFFIQTPFVLHSDCAWYILEDNGNAELQALNFAWLDCVIP